MNFGLDPQEFVAMMDALSARHDQLDWYVKVEEQVVERGGDDTDLVGFSAQLKLNDHTWAKLSRQADSQDPDWVFIHDD